MKKMLMLLGMVSLTACNNITGPSETKFTLYRWDVISTKSTRCAKDTRYDIDRDPDGYVYKDDIWIIVKYGREGIYAIFEQSTPFHKFCAAVPIVE